MFPHGGKLADQLLFKHDQKLAGFWAPNESHVPGEYLVTLDLAQISLDQATGRTPKSLPFGVNGNFQQLLGSLAATSTLDYFAPLHANGFASRTEQATLPAASALTALWERSQLDPSLKALQWNLGSEEAKRAAARAYLQHMVMRFTDSAKGAEAVSKMQQGPTGPMQLKSLGILQIEPMAARHIPVQTPDSIGNEIKQIPQPANKPPSKGMPTPLGDPPGSVPPQWWEDGLGLSAWRQKRYFLLERIQLAVLDTGCDVAHPHLQANFITQPFGVWLDRSGHGTHVCGILLAKMPSSGPKLLLPDGIGADLFALRVYKVVSDIQAGNGPSSTWKAKVRSQLYISALDHLIGSQKAGANVRAVNISLCGDAPFSTSNTNPERMKFISLQSLGVIPVAAAGNGNTMGPNVMYPACYKEVISAGALQSYGPAKTWEFSNRGTAYVNAVDKSQKAVDVEAPGANINSTYVVVTGDENNEKRSLRAAVMSGTSMAAPMVSAAIAIRSRKLALKTDDSNSKKLMTWVEGLSSIDLSSADYELPK